MNKKVVIGVIVFIAVLISGAMVYSNNTKSAVLEKTQGAKLQGLETSFDFKTIPYSGGKAIHGFKIKNAGTKDLTIANMVTSCMCTNAYLQTAKEKGPEFGMKGMAQPSSWKGVLAPGEEGKIIAVFDPAYHGPSGIGPISRIVSFETNDPDHPYVEFTFQGTVVK